jgi:hypothetical protein
MVAAVGWILFGTQIYTSDKIDWLLQEWGISDRMTCASCKKGTSERRECVKSLIKVLGNEYNID